VAPRLASLAAKYSGVRAIASLTDSPISVSVFEQPQRELGASIDATGMQMKGMMSRHGFRLPDPGGRPPAAPVYTEGLSWRS
jgi:hypothetical protein